MTRTLFLAWQDPSRRKWYPIGRLRSKDGSYSFSYTQGALSAREEAGFSPLLAFPNFESVFTSDELFPLFSNRLLRTSRPEYKQVLNWLSVQEEDADPVAILARSGGQRVTDTLEVFPCPEKLHDGTYELHFLVHGLSHMPEESVQRTETLKPGDRLLLMSDFQNFKDPLALALRTSEQYPRDMFLVGYCPRYLSGDIFRLMEDRANAPVITVHRINNSPAPLQFRILCKLRMRWSEGFEPFTGGEYEPIIQLSDEVRNEFKVA